MTPAWLKSGLNRVADPLDDLPNLPCVLQDVLDAFGGRRVAAKVLLQHPGGVVQDLINRRGDFAQHARRAGGGGRRFFDHEQLQRIQGDCDFAAEQFQELQIVLRKSTWLRAFDV